MDTSLNSVNREFTVVVSSLDVSAYEISAIIKRHCVLADWLMSQNTISRQVTSQQSPLEHQYTMNLLAEMPSLHSRESQFLWKILIKYSKIASFASVICITKAHKCSHPHTLQG